MQKDPIHITARCPIRTTLEMLGGKWKLLIIFQLAEAPLRFSELKRRLPDISEKMLVQELKSLQVSGLVDRENFGEVPPRVEYSLTERGRLALPVIRSMRDFAQGYVAREADEEPSLTKR
jgi:DNA-binding HxlR family transcriptional regulator